MLFKNAANSHQTIYDSICTQSDDLMAMAKKIFDHPEIGMEEYYACQTVAEYMRSHGFQVHTSNIEDPSLAPNCVAATYGGGKPVIGILGEYDALPGCGQAGGVPHPQPLDGPGHGCYHNLSSPAGCGAAVALKAAMQAYGLSGTVKFISCPAEENKSGKVAMAAQGYFDGLDVAVFFHGGGKFRVGRVHHSACSGYLFEFFGKAAHAAMNPEKGISALDTAELMNIGVQYLREHLAPGTSVAYTFIHGGGQPGTVPAYAATQYSFRAPTRPQCNRLIERIKKVAEGAALMTGATWKATPLNETFETLHNDVLESLMQQTSQRLPDLQYDEQDLAFVQEMYRTLHNGQDAPNLEALLTRRIQPETPPVFIRGATDLGDVSQRLPTLQFNGGAEVEGCIGHDWTAACCAGSSYGLKAAVYAAFVMAEFACELLLHPEKLQEAWAEFEGQKRQAACREE